MMGTIFVRFCIKMGGQVRPFINEVRNYDVGRKVA
jgi:hypothetical protein